MPKDKKRRKDLLNIYLCVNGRYNSHAACIDSQKHWNKMMLRYIGVEKNLLSAYNISNPLWNIILTYLEIKFNDNVYKLFSPRHLYVCYHTGLTMDFSYCNFNYRVCVKCLSRMVNLDYNPEMITFMGQIHNFDNKYVGRLTKMSTFPANFRRIIAWLGLSDFDNIYIYVKMQ